MIKQLKIFKFTILTVRFDLGKIAFLVLEKKKINKQLIVALFYQRNTVKYSEKSTNGAEVYLVIMC